MNRLLYFVTASLAVLITFNLPAQNKFDPFPNKNEDKYHLDFSNYFKSAEAAKQELTILYRKLDSFSSKGKKNITSAEQLLNTLDSYNALLVQYYRIYLYYNLRSSVNKADFESKTSYEEVENAFNSKTSFIETQLAAITKSNIASYLLQKPALKKYAYFIENIQRNNPHRISQRAETKVEQVLPLINNWQFDLFSYITGSVNQDFSKSGNSLANLQSGNDSLRKASFVKYYELLNAKRESLAFTLVRLARAEDAKAVLHNFSDAADYYYFDKFQSKESINTIFRQIIDSIGIYRHYQEIQAKTKEQLIHTNKVHYWDLNLSANTVMPRFTADTATTIILSALNPLGITFTKELNELFNPGNGRMEIAPSPDKRSGGFSRGYIGTASVFYAKAYRGFYNDIRVITHEATHAVHRQLMSSNKVLPVYAAGPNYFFESFAIFSEFLLTDYFLEHSTTNAEKQFYLEQYFQNKGMAMFSIAADALLEQKIHEGVKNKTINTADDLDAVNNEVNKIFSI